jgi:hypothetical protein
MGGMKISFSLGSYIFWALDINAKPFEASFSK